MSAEAGASDYSVEELRGDLEEALGYIKSRDYRDAADTFQSLIVLCKDLFGDEESVHLAELYYGYANATMLEAENSETALWTGGVGKGGEDADDEEEEDDPFESSWMVLEIARRSLERALGIPSTAGDAEASEASGSGAEASGDAVDDASRPKLYDLSNADDLRKLRLLLAQVYVREGDCLVLGNNEVAAVEEYKRGLAIREQLLPPSSRLLAESHYQIALALATAKRSAEAAEHFTSAQNILSARLAELKAMEAPEADDTAEIEDLEAVIVDLRETIAATQSAIAIEEQLRRQREAEAAEKARREAESARLPVIQLGTFASKKRRTGAAGDGAVVTATAADGEGETAASDSGSKKRSHAVAADTDSLDEKK